MLPLRAHSRLSDPLTRPGNLPSGKEDTGFEESEKAGQNVQRLTLRQPLIDHHRPA